MARASAPSRRWLVIRVWRGIPAEVRVYRRCGNARRRERYLREAIQPEDEVGLFELDLKGKATAVRQLGST